MPPSKTPVKLNGSKCEIVNVGMGLRGLERDRLIGPRIGRERLAQMWGDKGRLSGASNQKTLYK